MSLKNFIKTYFQILNEIFQKVDIDSVVEIIQTFEEKFNQGKTIFIAGNGGSAVTASHTVCDLNKTVLGKKPTLNKKRFKAICLSDNIPSLTAIGIEAIKTAKLLKMETVAFLGFDGGKAKNLVDSYVLIPSFDYGPVEDFHMILNHLITAYFKEKFAK